MNRNHKRKAGRPRLQREKGRPVSTEVKRWVFSLVWSVFRESLLLMCAESEFQSWAGRCWPGPAPSAGAQVQETERDWVGGWWSEGTKGGHYVEEIWREASRLRVAFRVYSRVLNSIQDWTRSHWRSHWRIRTVTMRGGVRGGGSEDGREKYDGSYSSWIQKDSHSCHHYTFHWLRVSHSSNILACNMLFCFIFITFYTSDRF